MKTSIAALFVLSFLLLSVPALGSTSCPVHIMPGTDVSISPGGTINVGDELSIKIVKDLTKVPVSGLEFRILYYGYGNELLKEYFKTTNYQGVTEFTPGNSGKYMIPTSDANVMLTVVSHCGDGVCSIDEDRTNCAKDCADCGDKICDTNEDKVSCPDDCIICGDGVCDVGESRTTCPADCAECGDGVCDTNEDKNSCPVDCQICGDGVCDPIEMLGLHQTSCALDCSVCGDGYCDGGEEEICALDCSVCGDGVCKGNENSSNCPEDCFLLENTTNETDNGSGLLSSGTVTVCGDGNCSGEETKESCPEDCTVCGDGICSSGENTGNCPQDCPSSGESGLMGFFLIPIVLAIIVIVFEFINHTRNPIKHKVAREPKAGVALGTKLKEIELDTVTVYIIAFIACLIIATALLAVIGLSYERNLAIFDLFGFMAQNAILISLIVIFLAAGLGSYARATYYMAKKQAVQVTMILALIGLIPGIFIFLNIEYLFVFFGLMLGCYWAVNSVKSEEEIETKSAWKTGAEFTDKMLTIGAIFACIIVFVSVYTNSYIPEQFAKAIWDNDATKEMMAGTYSSAKSEEDILKDVVEPFFEGNTGGVPGRLVFAGAIALLLLVILKIFIIITRELAGFFAWMLERNGILK